MKQFLKDLSIPAVIFIAALVACACLIPPEVHADVCGQVAHTRNDFAGAAGHSNQGLFTATETCTVTEWSILLAKNGTPLADQATNIINYAGNVRGSTVAVGTAMNASSGTYQIATSTYVSGSGCLTSGVQYAVDIIAQGAAPNYWSFGLYTGGSNWYQDDVSQGEGLILNVQGTPGCSGGGGGGATTTPDLTATSTIEQSQTNLFYAVDIYFASMFFVVWFFKRRS